MALLTSAGTAISDYNIALKDADSAKSSYRVETVFGADPASVMEGSGEAFPKYKPFESLEPYAMYVLKLNPK
jgi:hypothetical protein